MLAYLKNARASARHFSFVMLDADPGCCSFGKASLRLSSVCWPASKIERAASVHKNDVIEGE
jgi:hypothetical protein